MSRRLKETTSQVRLRALASERMRVRSFSPGWRRTVRLSVGYFFSKTRLSDSASCVFIAVYHTTSPPVACARAWPTGASRHSASADAVQGARMSAPEKAPADRRKLLGGIPLREVLAAVEQPQVEPRVALPR